ncbi:TSUP family transporter, partial [Cyanobium sp. A2C-AMD]
MLWSLLPYLPLGLLAGLLSGVLGIGGGLVFSPLLLLAGLDPHKALATSTLAIVPTTLGGTWAHLRNRSLPWRGGLAIVLGAGLGA